VDATSIDYNSCGLLLCGIDSLCSYNLHAMQLMQPRQPIPQVTAEDVERVARRDFSADEYGTVMAALSEYGTEKWQREAARVQLAALKVANGSVQQLRACIELAKRDYRDVLAAAEYPAYYKIGFQVRKLPAEEQSRIIHSDWRQYEEWLKR
jgi:hypothetical protein